MLAERTNTQIYMNLYRKVTTGGVTPKVKCYATGNGLALTLFLKKACNCFIGRRSSLRREGLYAEYLA